MNQIILKSSTNHQDIANTICHLENINQKLQTENTNLKAIIAKEISENDEFGAEYVITSILKAREHKLLDVISEMQKALEQYGNKNNWRFSANNDVGAFDAWLDFKSDHACFSVGELGGYTARKVLAKVDALMKEIGVGK